MPVFQYKAKNKSAETVYGQVIADHREAAIEKVNELGLLPVHVEDQVVTRRQKQRFMIRRVGSRDLYFFSRQLVILLKAGVPILQSLDIIAAQIKDWHFKDIVQNVRLDIKEGTSFSNALSAYPEVFSGVYVAMAKAGEESGTLKETVAEMAAYQQRQAAFNSKVRTALAYPLFMLVFGIGTVVFILTFVMPKITGLFTHLNQALPVPTVIVMKLSVFFLEYWMWLALLILVFITVMNQAEKSSAFRIFKSRLKLNTPFLGDFLLKVELARFCRAFELLIKSGLPILRALHLAVPLIGNQVMRDELAQCEDDLAAGKAFGESIKKIKILPPIAGHLIAVGEESGSIVISLHEIAEAFEQETEETMTIMTTYLEPLMIIVVGGIVGLIVIAMLLPIFQLDVFAG